MLSSFQSHRQSFTIHPTKQYNSHTGDPLLANPVLVSTSLAVAEISTIGNQDAKNQPRENKRHFLITLKALANKLIKKFRVIYTLKNNRTFSSIDASGSIFKL